MAAFASDRRSGWVRVLVLILCALFIFATIATPPAYAVGETVALFGLAAVLSSATAALGFKLANNAEGQATLEKMVQDFAGASIAAGLVLTGTKVNGLINGMQYIKMAVHDGKTYLDERVLAWCQQWLAQQGVYDSVVQGSYIGASVSYPFQVHACGFDAFYSGLLDLGYSADFLSGLVVLVKHYNLYDYFSSTYVSVSILGENIEIDVDSAFPLDFQATSGTSSGGIRYFYPPSGYTNKYTYYKYTVGDVSSFKSGSGSRYMNWITLGYYKPLIDSQAIYGNFSFSVTETSNNTGLSGTDTLGKDVIDLTLDQILDRLKEWAQDWYDAGADSVTNAATGAKDLPLTVGEKAATANPALNPDDVYNPPFALPLPGLRSGETDTKTVEQGKENASAAETATTDVAENQTVIDSLVNWALGYISPDTGLFSKFPLCVPYDAYLLACAALGVDVVESDSIFSASPDDLSSIVQTGTDEQSEGFTPVFTISNDLTLDGYTYPLKLTIDLTEWTPLIKFFRLAISITVIAELIGAEYKRIKGK